MKKVTGIGGVFFKSKNVPALKEWYRDHLGFRTTEWGASIIWGDIDPHNKSICRTEWSPFKEDSDYYAPSTEPFMINYRVHDLRQLMDSFKSEGVQVVGELQEYDYGKFAHILDPEKRKIELWEPVDEGFGDAPPLWNERVTGLGGVFFVSKNPEATKEWYSKHLGVLDTFRWRDLANPSVEGQTVWAPLEKDSMFFQNSNKPYMFNYRVKDLVALLGKLKAEGVKTSDDFEQMPHGKFAWVWDPEGTKSALWEP
ncbi:MAG TPA: VOC family protein [Cyclobacteriaceae bacterium]|nr:VOC family protein [Cyclobacteriaceae bacterium]